MSSYRLYLNSERTDHVVKAPTPGSALRALCGEAGLVLASQDGRYGRLADGTSVSAMTLPWSAARYADHGVTRS